MTWKSSLTLSTEPSRIKIQPAAKELFASDDVALRFVPESAFTWDERVNAATDALREADGAFPLVPTAPRGSA